MEFRPLLRSLRAMQKPEGRTYANPKGFAARSGLRPDTPKCQSHKGGRG